MAQTNIRSSAATRVEESQNIQLLQSTVTSTGDQVTVALAGEIDLSTADALGELLQGVVATKPARVVVDLAQVSFLDSSGIHRLLTAAHAATDVGCTLRVTNPSDIIMRVLTICGVDDFLLDEGAQRS